MLRCTFKCNFAAARREKTLRSPLNLAIASEIGDVLEGLQHCGFNCIHWWIRGLSNICRDKSVALQIPKFYCSKPPLTLNLFLQIERVKVKICNNVFDLVTCAFALLPHKSNDWSCNETILFRFPVFAIIWVYKFFPMSRHILCSEQLCRIVRVGKFN